MSLSTIKAFKRIKSKDAIVLSDEQLHDLQQTLNEMLDDIAAICAKYDLHYECGGGTCLGAVRHHGFIPWDDDIDINMPRKDHDTFVRVFRQEMGDRYWVHTPKETDGYGLLLSRVLKKGTSVRTREDFWNEECGAFIDIFVIENTYDNPILRNIHGLGCMAYGLLQSCRKFYRDREPLMQLVRAGEDEASRQYERTFRLKIALGWCLSFASLDWWIRRADRWYSMCHDEHSRYVTVPSGRGHFYGELYRREDVCEYVPMAYDGGTKMVPAAYDMYLTRMYGDYMTIPAEADREQHIFFAPFYLTTPTADGKDNE